MIKIVKCLLLLCISFSLFAKPTSPLCTGVVGPAFTTGNGSLISPYLICNIAQLNSLSSVPTRLTQNFIMGADLDYTSTPFPIIGSLSGPFQGTFDGNGHTLSSVKLNASLGSSYIGIFGIC